MKGIERGNIKETHLCLAFCTWTRKNLHVMLFSPFLSFFFFLVNLYAFDAYVIGPSSNILIWVPGKTQVQGIPEIKPFIQLIVIYHHLSPNFLCS